MPDPFKAEGGKKFEPPDVDFDRRHDADHRDDETDTDARGGQDRPQRDQRDERV